MSSRKMLVKKGAVVIRDGRRVRPEIGKTFTFSDAEIDQLNGATPGTLGPVSEAQAEDGDATAKASATSSAAEGSQTGAKAGRKRATAGTSDTEAKTTAKTKTAGAEDGDDDL